MSTSAPAGRRFLLGNSFPLSLIRRRVVVEPRPMEELIVALREGEVASFWGHANTVVAVSSVLGVDLRPRTARPALTLGDSGLPVLDGVAFEECWILSPDYEPGFRPEIGAEVTPDKIRGWLALRIRWEGCA